MAAQTNYSSNYGGGSTFANVVTAITSSSATAAALAASAATGNINYSGMSYISRNIEGQIMRCVFKSLVTRFSKSSKELKSQENIALYSDVRQFVIYVKEAHGGIFRRVALSGILDSSDRPNKRCTSRLQTTRVIR